MKFEEALEKLEMIIEKLEKEELPLEESIKLFEEGIGLYKFCNKELNEAEKKIISLVEEDKKNDKLTSKKKTDV